MSEIRDFVYSNVLQLKNLLRGDVARAKVSLARHLGRLVLTPTQTPEGPVYEVSGGFDLLAGNNDVMPVVARDGIEPPTPAFSGLLTDKAKRFGINASRWGTKAYGRRHLGSFGME